eukprot:jgi/Botrbrau1/11791/Bobra.0195s0115.1
MTKMLRLREFFAALCLLLLASSVCQGRRNILQIPAALPPAVAYMAADCQTFPRDPAHVCKSSLVTACCNMATQLCQIRQPKDAACPATSSIGCCPNFNV